MCSVPVYPLHTWLVTGLPAAVLSCLAGSSEGRQDSWITGEGRRRHPSPVTSCVSSVEPKDQCGNEKMTNLGFSLNLVFSLMSGTKGVTLNFK